MAKWRIQITAEPVDQAKWLEVRDLVEANLTTGVFDRPVAWTFEEAKGSLLANAVFHGRFLTQTDANRVWTFLQRTPTRNALRARLVRAVLSRHLCTHDDPVVQDCRTTQYEEVTL